MYRLKKLTKSDIGIRGHDILYYVETDRATCWLCGKNIEWGDEAYYCVGSASRPALLYCLDCGEKSLNHDHSKGFQSSKKPTHTHLRVKVFMKNE